MRVLSFSLIFVLQGREREREKIKFQLTGKGVCENEYFNTRKKGHDNIHPPGQSSKHPVFQFKLKLKLKNYRLKKEGGREGEREKIHLPWLIVGEQVLMLQNVMLQLLANTAEI